MECWVKGGLIGLGYTIYCIAVLTLTDHLSNIGNGLANFLLVLFIILSITALPYIALKAGFTPILNLFGLRGEWACRITCGVIMIILFGFFAWVFRKAKGNNVLKIVNNRTSNHFT